MTASGNTNANDESRGDRAIPRQEPENRAPVPRQGFAQSIKKLFREAVKAISGKAPAPNPKRRRKKRDEDTRGLFKKLAMKILAPFARSVFDHLGDFNCFTPPDDLDETQRLMQREWRSQDAAWQHEHNRAFHHDRTNHLSPPF